MIKLLLIEDDTNLSYIIRSSLEEVIGNYEVHVAYNGEEGIRIFNAIEPDIIVSDIEMPILNGMDMVKKIRQKNKETPIIFASGKSSSKDVISGYDIGVNNYIKKPFLPEELDAHIKAILNLKNDSRIKIKKSIHQIGQYLFDPKNLTLIFDTQKQTLTSRECRILELLYEGKGEIVRREDILMKFWGISDSFTSRSLDVFITKMRRYLSKDPAISIINVKAVGLILNVG